VLIHYQWKQTKNRRYLHRFHGVTVSTQDFESCDPSSNLGGTLFFNVINYCYQFKSDNIFFGFQNGVKNQDGVNKEKNSFEVQYAFVLKLLSKLGD
jgi:hypothetical protein